ncbi:hypothetical protein [Cellulosimicrobium protaetiae]
MTTYTTRPDDTGDLDGVVTFDADTDKDAMLTLGGHLDGGARPSPRGPFTLLAGRLPVARYLGPDDKQPVLLRAAE